jgi:hypothetical protein
MNKKENLFYRKASKDANSNNWYMEGEPSKWHLSFNNKLWLFVILSNILAAIVYSHAYFTFWYMFYLTTPLPWIFFHIHIQPFTMTFHQQVILWLIIIAFNLSLIAIRLGRTKED